MEGEEPIRNYSEWRKLRRSHFKLEKSKTTSKTGQQKMLPAGHIRQIMKAHGDMSHKKFAGQKRLYIGGLKYAPHAVLKLLENMPMPWEEKRTVKVLYHTAGALTFVNEVPKVIPPQYLAQWAATWISMRREKRDRHHFRRIRFPPFDDEEPPLDYVTNIDGIEPPEAVLLELDEDEDKPIIDWFYDHLGLYDSNYVNGLSYKRWQFPLTVMSNLYRLAKQLVGDFQDPNLNYLFDLPSLMTSKALNEVIPGAPSFEPLFKDGDPNEDWTEFNDINKIITRRPIDTEVKIAFPHLYNNRPRKISIAPYHYPCSNFVELENPDLPPFIIGSRIINISFKGLDSPLPSPELEDFEVPCDPLFSDIEVDDEAVFDTLSLFFAPPPFNARSGQTQRAQDIPLCRSWYMRCSPFKTQLKVRVSYQKMLGRYVLNRVHHRQPRTVRRKKGIVTAFKGTPYFMSTNLDWVEAGLQVIQQGFNMCNLLIQRHRLVFLHLDYNFNLKPIKTLNTKERRKSRFGNGYHMMREFFRFTKMLVDCHVQYRLGQVDAYALADALQYTFSHAGHLTGMYRYKYRVMRQIRACKDLKHLIYSRFNAGSVGPGPGVGFWGPMWRVWVFFLRGMVPLMERWLGSRVAREYEGRFAKRGPSTVTKQRAESNYDLELRAAVMHDIMDVMPEEIANRKAHTVMQHLSEAWRCWKANIPWKIPGLPPPLEAIILRYVKAKADWWVSNTHYARERIAREGTIDKGIVRKNTGRLTRQYMMEQAEIQANFLKDGPEQTAEEATAMLTTMSNWLTSREFTKIPFPPMNYKHDTKMLILALESLRFGHDVSMRMNQALKEELGLIEYAHDNPHETLNNIKRSLLSDQRKATYQEVKISFLDHYTRLIPVYEINALEKITDAYLDQYLWYEADRRRLFPPWVKPSDLEPAPVLVNKWCKRINNLAGAWDTDEGESMVLVEAPLQKFYEKVNPTLLNSLLRLIMDHNLANYITAKNNVTVSFKDMKFVNRCGLIHGLQFTSFVAQYVGLMIDLLILGLRRASDIVGPPSQPNTFLEFSSVDDEVRHPIRLYQRYATRIHILYKFTDDQARELTRDYLMEHPDPNNENIIGYRNKMMWPRDARMRLVKHDVNLGRAVFWNLMDSLPRSIVGLDWDKSFVSVYSRDNPNLLFYMCGFEVRILPRIRMDKEEFTPMEGTWTLQNERTKETTAYAFLKVSEKSITYFKNRTRQILLSSQATTFAKVSNKWNTAIISLVTYFREAIVATPELLDMIVRCENRVQTRVKLGLNSKMPNRFPPVVFYTPKEFGGLGLVSMGHVLIPQADIRYSTQTDVAPTHFRVGLQHNEQRFIPALYRYVQTWEGEIADSERVWEHYKQIRKEAGSMNKKITIEDLDALWDRGIPRINTLFQKDRHTLAYDKGWRSRLYFKKFSLFKTNPYSWTHTHHDGKLWNLKDYRADVIQALGGVEGILSHSVFPATGYKRWEGLFWDNTTGFEEALKYRKLTNAQRMGLSQVPNRRFVLWWSPTINRANVYVGFQVQLDLTGIFMHGKIPTLKMSYMQLFRAHMWQKTHDHMTVDVIQALDNHRSELQIDDVNKQQIHPMKAIKMNTSCADIIIVAASKWPVTDPCFSDAEPQFQLGLHTTRLWFDIQLRWGDYDSHDIKRYTRSLFNAYTTDTQNLYPSETGIMIGIDLCYNTWAAYGTWIPGLQELIEKAMKNSMAFNPCVSMLRERVRKALQLYSSTPQEPALTSSNFSEMFGSKTTWIVEDKHTYRTKVQKSFEGNFTATPVNGGVFIINPATGQAYLKIIHTAAWQQQKRLQQLAKWKAAEETATIVRSLPPEEQPRQIICTRELLLDPMQNFMHDFPNITVKGSDMELPVAYFMKIAKIANVVRTSDQPKTLLYNMYDDWLQTISPFTAFSRLMLIMRALGTDTLAALDIMRPDASVEVRQDHLWPTHTPEEWDEIHIRLKELIVGKYCEKNNVPPGALTVTEQRDIIFGVKIAPPSEERQALAAEEDSKAGTTTAVTTLTRNADGYQQVVTTMSAYEQTEFQSKSDWRQRAFKATMMPHRAAQVRVPPEGIDEDERRIVIPQNLLKRFVEIADPSVQVAALMFGEDTEDAVVIQAFVVPPQSGKAESVTFVPQVPQCRAIGHLRCAGWIHTTGIEEGAMDPAEAIAAGRILSANPGLDPHSLATVCVGFPVGNGCVVHGYRLTPGGLEWAAKNVHTRDRPTDFEEGAAVRLPVVLDDSNSGFFVVPEQGWNFNFMPLQLEGISEYEADVGVPAGFYDQRHRPMHFLKFVNEMSPSYASVDTEDQFI